MTTIRVTDLRISINNIPISFAIASAEPNKEGNTQMPNVKPQFTLGGLLVNEYDIAVEQPPGRVEAVPPGIYKLFGPQPMRGPFYQEFRPNLDKLTEFKGGVAKEVVDDINNFLTPEVEARFRRYGFQHRRGILVYGKPGTGKTSLFFQIANKFVADGGIVFFNPELPLITQMAKYIRAAKPDQKILVILEEFDDLLECGWENTLLQLLDGGNSLSQIVYLASTNYIENVPKRFKSRPSRFALVTELPPPDAETRREYLSRVVHVEDRKLFNLDKVVEATEGMVLDQLKDVVVSAICLGSNVEGSIKKLREMDALEDAEDDE